MRKIKYEAAKSFRYDGLDYAPGDEIDPHGKYDDKLLEHGFIRIVEIDENEQAEAAPKARRRRSKANG